MMNKLFNHYLYLLIYFTINNNFILTNILYLQVCLDILYTFRRAHSIHNRLYVYLLFPFTLHSYIYMEYDKKSTILVIAIYVHVHTVYEQDNGIR